MKQSSGYVALYVLLAITTGISLALASAAAESIAYRETVSSDELREQSFWDALSCLEKWRLGMIAQPHGTPVHECRASHAYGMTVLKATIDAETFLYKSLEEL